MRAIGPFILLVFLLTSCEKTIQLDLNNSASRVVIEGVLTDVSGNQFVRVSRSYGFYDKGEPPAVADAEVQVRDDQGNEMNFIYNPSNPELKQGYYYPEDNIFKGVIGRVYSLTVVVDGETYFASDTLLRVTSIDSLGYRVDPFEKKDPRYKDKYYQVLLYAKEPQATRDYYLFKFYGNDSIQVYDRDEIYIADDRTLGEKIDGVPSPVYYAVGDTATVEMYSLTRSGYLFYNDLSALLNSDGGMFSPPPANCRTNLTNGALGFFQVSALSVDTVIIHD